MVFFIYVIMDYISTAEKGVDMAKIIPVFVSYAGCPHICAFCNQHTINNQKEVSLAAVKAQIDKYLLYMKDTDDKDIAFYGGSFTGMEEGLQEELLSLALTMKKSGVIKNIRMSTRPDYIDEAVIGRLLKYEVDLVELGVQSMDDDVLLTARRGHDCHAVMKAADLLRAAGINFGIQLMAGLPGQDWNSIKYTVRKVIELKPAVLRIYPLVIFKDTYFAELFQKDEISLLDFDTVCRQVAWMADELEANGINIIRIGLQDDEGLHEQGSIIAGYYHPAFGEIIASIRYRDKIDAVLSKAKSKKVKLLIPENDISKAVGHKKMNAGYFAQKYPDMDIHMSKAACDDIKCEECDE